MSRDPLISNPIEKLPALIWLASPDGHAHWFNSAWCEYRGRHRDDELGVGWHSSIHPDDKNTFFAGLAEHASNQQPFRSRVRVQHRAGDFRQLLVEAAAIGDDDETTTRVLGTCVELDATAHDHTSSEFFENALDLACVAGFDGYFKRVNKSWVDTMGWTREELFARPILEFVHPADRQGVIDARSQLKSDAPMGPLTNRYRHKDGSFRWLEWRSVAHPDERLVFAMARDITELQRSRQELSRSRATEERLKRQLTFADRMASIGTLAAGVAHEVNNPLSFLMGNLSIIQERLEGADEHLTSDGEESLVDILEDAREGAKRIQKIVAGLQTFSGIEEQELMTFHVRSVVDQAIDMVENQIRHHATLRRDHGAAALVHADESRLRQVVVDLLINASQAIPSGDTDENEVRVSTFTDVDNYAVIEVRDTGEGIPEEELVRIFDPFFTTRPIGVGTGMGLSIARNIVDGLGGEVTVESTVGEGSTFRVRLPAARESRLTHDTEPHRDPPFDVRGASVLVVDDEPAVGRFIRRVLDKHEVTAVDRAEHALRLLDEGREFHIVFVDVMMPHMSGMDFHDQLQTRFPATAERVVFITGGAFTDDAQAFLDRVPNERVDKPMSNRTLRSLTTRFAEIFG